MRIIYLPLPIIEQRYTSEWYWMFPEVFREEGIDYVVVEGNQCQSKLSKVFFLDYSCTLKYFMEQITKTLDIVEDGDTIFIPDGEMPGLEAFGYYRKFYKKKFKVVEIWHAGTYDPYDLTAQYGCTPFGQKFEEGWMEVADVIFVGSNFHKKLILDNRNVESDKVFVTGLPVNIPKLFAYDTSSKEDMIAYTGRKSFEKGYYIIKKLISENVPIKVTLDETKTKDEYYELLSKSKAVISPAYQETFGYGVIEGMALNCIPIVPDRLSYQEIVPEKFRYRTADEMYKLIDSALSGNVVNTRKYVSKYDYRKVIRRMLAIVERFI